jgi:hypothetical protein
MDEVAVVGPFSFMSSERVKERKRESSAVTVCVIGGFACGMCVCVCVRARECDARSRKRVCTCMREGHTEG